MPDLKLTDISGQPQRLSGLKGNVSVVSFWATWCGPCKEELPRLDGLKKRHAAEGVRFVAISIDDRKDRPKVLAYLHNSPLSLDIWLGGDEGMLERVGLGDIVPSTLILDADGVVVTRIMGEAQEADIEHTLEWLRNNRQGPAPERLLRRY